MIPYKADQARKDVRRFHDVQSIEDVAQWLFDRIERICTQKGETHLYIYKRDCVERTWNVYSSPQMEEIIRSAGYHYNVCATFDDSMACVVIKWDTKVK